MKPIRHLGVPTRELRHLAFPIECHCGWKGDTNWKYFCPTCGCSPYLPEPDENCSKKKEINK